MKQLFDITGMTCESCVEKITEKLKAIAGVRSVHVSLTGKNAEIESDQEIALVDFQNALKSMPKYTIENSSAKMSKTMDIVTESKLKTYKPLIIIFAYIILISLAYQMYNGSFEIHIFMNHIMAGFFLGLSFFKVLDLTAFSDSFTSYDPLAQRFLLYGKVYPFIELMLGLLFVSGCALIYANSLTVIILSITTYGVIVRLRSKSNFQCACLGGSFNLPLSYVTVVENVVMILMASYSLFMLI